MSSTQIGCGRKAIRVSASPAQCPDKMANNVKAMRTETLFAPITAGLTNAEVRKNGLCTLSEVQYAEV